jgi:hypothetical protein
MKSYYSDIYPGLLVQLSLNDGERYIISDLSWRVKKDESWDSKSTWVSKINANNYNSCINFREAEKRWMLSTFNDESWPSAVYQLGAPVWPARPKSYVPHAIQKPWLSLIPRDLPPLKEFNLKPKAQHRVSEAPQYSKQGWWGEAQHHDALHRSAQDVQKDLKFSRVEHLNDFLLKSKPFIVKNSYPDPQEKFGRQVAYHTTIVFDFGSVVDGYPYMKMQGAGDSIIDVNYAPYLLDGTFVPGVLVDNFSDRLNLSGKSDQWENSELRTLRYLAITVRGASPVKIVDLGVRVTEYPFEKKGHLVVESEKFIEDLWKAGDRTLQSVTTDAFTDNYQERRQYVQTAFYAARGAYASFGDTWLQRRLLIQHAQDQLPDGIMPMWAPWSVYDENNMTPGIFEANHFWLMGLRDYLIYSGDRSSVKALLDNAERVAASIYRYQRKGRLLYKCPHAYWIDWAKLTQGDENFIINALQLLSFQNLSETLSYFNRSEAAKLWSERAKVIRDDLAAFWNAEEQLFSDNRNDGALDSNFSEHANALAIVTGVANMEQKILITNKLLNNDTKQSMERASLFHYWVFEAIASQGHIREGVEMLKRRYQHMLDDKEVDTLWEFPNLHVQDRGSRETHSDHRWVGRSWCTAQAENAYPADSLSRWILGLTPTTPGMTRLSFSTFSSPYQQLSGDMPTPNGLVKVKRNGNIIDIELPKGIELTISVAEQKKWQATSLSVGMDSSVLGKKEITIGSGAHVMEIK